MEYENRQPPEGINVSEEHPLKEFFILVLGLGVFTVLVVAALSLSAGWLAHYVPFEIEKELFHQVMSRMEADSQGSKQSDEESAEDEHSEQQRLRRIGGYLQTLAEQLSSAQQLPEGMSVTVHYVDNDTINAFATLGGNIYMFRGLIEQLPHENALAMVLAHEIAHIKHRDPLVAIGRGITVGIALSSLAGFGDSALTQQLLGQVGLLTSLSFGRGQETAADEEALLTLSRHYGHAGGAEVLFDVLQRSHEGLEPPAFLSTHPLTSDRIDAVHGYQSAAGTGDFQPLPEFLNAED